LDRLIAFDGQRLGQKHARATGDLLNFAELYAKMDRSADTEPLCK
jgi:hypothetical protein